MRIKALFSLAALGFASLAFAQAQNVVVEERKTETVTVVVKETPKPPAFVFELHGFISTTGFFQDAPFNAYGQKALFVGGKYEADKPVFGFDIRQTRLNFSVRGPADPGRRDAEGRRRVRHVRLDEFRCRRPASTATSRSSPASAWPTSSSNWDSGKHILQIGQQNMLTIGTIPQSLRGIAFPMTYAAGTVGWRSAGRLGLAHLR